MRRRRAHQAIIKIQYVDLIPKAVKGKVGEILKAKDQRGAFDEAVDVLDLQPVLGVGADHEDCEG